MRCSVRAVRSIPPPVAVGITISTGRVGVHDAAWAAPVATEPNAATHTAAKHHDEPDIAMRPGIARARRAESTTKPFRLDRRATPAGWRALRVPMLKRVRNPAMLWRNLELERGR